MAFENLTEKIQGTLKKLRGLDKVSESNIKDAMRDVKLALLEADVNFLVVKDFIAKVTEKAIGSEVLDNLNPAQQLVKIVNDELTELMGSENQKINFQNNPPTVIMMCGLQGAGKTTTSAKLGGLFKRDGHRPLLVACDVYRPAAIDQLQVVGGKLGIPVFTIEGSVKPIDISKKAMQHASEHGNDIVIIDTAGRLHIDEDLMKELKGIKDAVKVHETLLVVDAMVGQDSVNVAKSFNEQLEIDGVVLTKLDGDARGGSAISIRSVTEKPIKFIGVGEKLEDIEAFHPERMASRILGMGDVLSFIERAEAAIDQKKAAELEQKLKEQQFDLDDFLDQLKQIKKMGPIKNLLGMMPGVDAKALETADIDERKMDYIEAIIQSMTKDERANPKKLNASRRKRISSGSGRSVTEVNQLLVQFEQMKTMITKMTKGGFGMGNKMGKATKAAPKIKGKNNNKKKKKKKK